MAPWLLRLRLRTTCQSWEFSTNSTDLYIGPLFREATYSYFGAAGTGMELWRPFDDFMGVFRGRELADVGAFQ